MTKIQSLVCGLLATSILIGIGDPAYSEGENSVERLYNQYGIRFSDAHPCTMEMSKGRPCKSFVLSEVKEDSEAFFAGLRAGHTSSLFPQHAQRSEKTPEQYADDILYALRGARFRVGVHCEFSELLSAFQSGGSLEERFCTESNPNGIPFMFGRAAAETHIGIKIDSRGAVVGLLEPSPASVAGIKVGDRLLTPGIAGPSEDLMDNLSNLSRLMDNVLNKGQVTPFDRSGERVEINLPKVPYGQIVDPALAQTELSADEDEVFQKMPEIIRPFLVAVYGGRFKRAEFEKKAFYLKAYSSTLASQVGETAYGEVITERYNNLVEAARFGPLIAQYALVKLTVVGNCGNPVTAIPYTETLIETLENGHGVVLSQRILSQESKSFDIDTRFAPYVVKANQVSPRPRWSFSIGDFVRAAGGCGSEILKRFEENMLAYQQY